MASKYAIDTKAPLSDQLSYVPLEAWEAEFPILDLCLRESIRLNLPGTAFRQNVSGRDVKVGDEVIPDGHYVVSGSWYHAFHGISQTHLDRRPSIWRTSTRTQLFTRTPRSGTHRATSPTAPRIRKPNTLMLDGELADIRASACGSVPC